MPKIDVEAPSKEEIEMYLAVCKTESLNPAAHAAGESYAQQASESIKGTALAKFAGACIASYLAHAMEKGNIAAAMGLFPFVVELSVIFTTAWLDGIRAGLVIANNRVDSREVADVLKGIARATGGEGGGVS